MVGGSSPELGVGLGYFRAKILTHKFTHSERRYVDSVCTVDGRKDKETADVSRLQPMNATLA